MWRMPREWRGVARRVEYTTRLLLLFRPFSFLSSLFFAKLKTSFPFFFNFIFNFFAVTKVLSPTGNLHFSSLFFFSFLPHLLNSLSTSRHFLYLVAVMITRVERPLAVTTGNLPRQRLIASVKGKVYTSWRLCKVNLFNRFFILLVVYYAFIYVGIYTYKYFLWVGLQVKGTDL